MDLASDTKYQMKIKKINKYTQIQHNALIFLFAYFTLPKTNKKEGKQTTKCCFNHYSYDNPYH